MTLDKFTQAYIECAIWSSSDSSGEPLDRSDAALADETREKMLGDCLAFQTKHAALLAPFDAAQAGHDFWLTRNRHVSGFWDGDYPYPLGKQLTDAAHAFGKVTLYIGDDGQIYQT